MEIEWHPGKSLIAENGQSFFNFFKVHPVADTVSFGFIMVRDNLLNLVNGIWASFLKCWQIEEVQRQMERDYNIG